ncbi:MAG: amidohydrolase family protein [Acidobacteriota bacterium]
MRRTLSTLLFGLVLASCSRSTPEPGAAVVYEGARLIVGDGSAIEDSAFVVEKGEFRAVGKRGAVEAPAGAAHVDLKGKTVMPALVDAHAHLGWTLLKENRTDTDTYSRENLADHLRRYSYYGIAAVRNLGIDPGETAYEIRAQQIPGAALLQTAGRGIAMPNAGPGQAYWRPVAYGVSTDAEARATVRELAGKKVDIVKIWVDDRGGTVKKLTPALYRIIIDEAHKNNLRVVAHIFYLADAKDLVKAGIDGFAHGVRDIDVDDEFLGLMKAHPNVWMIPNLPDRGTSTGDLELATESLPPAQIQRMRENPTKPNLDLYNVQAGNLAKVNAAGVKIAFGTDAGVAVGWTAHQELADMVNAGMTPSQVLVAATKTAAEIMRLDKLGAVAAGKSANFLVLDANPLDDITNTRRISTVYLQGAAVDRGALKAGFTAP